MALLIGHHYLYTINSSTLSLSALKIMPAFVDIVIIIFVHVCYILPTNTINTYPWLNVVYTCRCISLLRVSFEEPRFSSLSPPSSWWVRLLFPLLWGCPGKVPGLHLPATKTTTIIISTVQNKEYYHISFTVVESTTYAVIIFLTS